MRVGCTSVKCEKKRAAEQMMGQPSTESSKEEVTKEVVMEDLPDGRVKATYTVSKHTVEDVKTFEGTKDEVSAQINALK